MLIYLTGGKTLGHITPLINIYKHFKEIHTFVYFGLENSLEEEMCKNNNITFIPLKLKGLNRKNLFKNLEVFYLIHKANKIIKKEIKPNLVIASSGFVCIPLLFKSNKTKIFLLEQNTTLGLVNKLFYHKCDKLFLSLPINKKLDKSILSGNFISNYKIDYDNIDFYKYQKKILVFFGSMGSSNLYKFFQENYIFKDYKIFIVLPDKYYDLYNFDHYIKLRSISNINSIFDKFDLIICRAGATTIAEIIKSNTKAILIPSPNVVNNHQLKNAILMKDNYLMDYIEEIDLINIESKLNDLSLYNNIIKRKEYYNFDPFDILSKYINNES